MLTAFNTPSIFTLCPQIQADSFQCQLLTSKRPHQVLCLWDSFTAHSVAWIDLSHWHRLTVKNQACWIFRSVRFALSPRLHKPLLSNMCFGHDAMVWLVTYATDITSRVGHSNLGCFHNFRVLGKGVAGATRGREQTNWRPSGRDAPLCLISAVAAYTRETFVARALIVLVSCKLVRGFSASVNACPVTDKGRAPLRRHRRGAQNGHVMTHMALLSSLLQR